MQRIDVSSASPTLPAPAAAGTPGYFTDGDPIAGVPATVVPGDFLNMIQEELRNVVVAGGLTPSKVDFTQVLNAIVALIGAKMLTASSFAPNGYVTFAFGLTIQWGTVALPSTSSSDIAQPFSYPVPFGTALYSLVGNADRGAGASWHPVVVTMDNAGLSGAVVTADSANTSQPISNAVNVRWIAIGK